MKIRAIITGATGMVGEGVLHECLLSSDVEAVLVVGRKPCGYEHPKLKEVLINDFFNVAGIQNQLTGYNACFFCLGVSSVGMNETDYFKLTHTLTLNFAAMLSPIGREITFCYISGAATDSTEKGKSMWARVKGKTENDLEKMPFKAFFAFRPGGLKPTEGLKYTQKYYKYVGWLFPIFNVLAPNTVSTLKELGLAMIQVAKSGYDKRNIEVKDIHTLAKRS